MPSEIIKKTRNSLNSLGFSTEDTVKLINNLYFNEAYGQDEFSIQMLKICGSSIFRLLEVYKSCLERGKFCLRISEKW